MLSVVAVLTVVLANQSGEALEDRIDADDDVEELVDRHADRGEAVMPWAFAVLVGSSAVVLAEPLRRRMARLTPTVATITLTVLGIVAAAGATASIVRAGHSGAEAVWTDNDHLEDSDDDDEDD